MRAARSSKKVILAYLGRSESFSACLRIKHGFCSDNREDSVTPGGCFVQIRARHDPPAENVLVSGRKIAVQDTIEYLGQQYGGQCYCSEHKRCLPWLAMLQ